MAIGLYSNRGKVRLHARPHHNASARRVRLDDVLNEYIQKATNTMAPRSLLGRLSSLFRRKV